jgi:formylglycine-generating enzyme required for sulfatase activity
MTSSARAYPNGVSEYGTYGQSGNVWEWCADRFDTNYHGKRPTMDPPEPEAGSVRVSRGGGWRTGAPSYFRGANRNRLAPGNRGDNLGFRLVRTE